MIFEYLGVGDQGAYRQTCRNLDSIVFSTFGRMHFTEMRFMLTHKSLMIGEDFSKSRYAPFLRFIILGNERLPRSPPASRAFQPDEEDIYCEQYANDNYFNWTGQDILLLTRIIENCPNVNSSAVHLGNRTTPGVGLKGIVRKSESCGFRRILGGRSKAITDREQRKAPLNEKEYNASLLVKLLSAMNGARRPPKFLSIPNAILDSAFNIPPYMEPSYFTLLSELSTFQVCLYSKAEWLSERRTIRQDGPCKTTTYHLRHFLRLCLNIRELAISWHRFPPCSPKGCFLQWLATPAPPPGPMTAVTASTSQGPQTPTYYDSPGPVALSHLRDLSLNIASISTGSMLRLFKKFGPSLNSLRLINVRLYNTTEDSNDPPPDDSINPWEQCILMLSTCVSDHFSYFLVQQLRFKPSNSEQWCWSYFQRHPEEPLIISGLFGGGHMKLQLEDLSRTMTSIPDDI